MMSYELLTNLDSSNSNDNRMFHALCASQAFLAIILVYDC